MTILQLESAFEKGRWNYYLILGGDISNRKSYSFGFTDKKTKVSKRVAQRLMGYKFIEFAFIRLITVS